MFEIGKSLHGVYEYMGEPLSSFEYKWLDNFKMSD